MQRQHVFLIGAARSGTTWLQTMLGSHPRVATTVEQTLFDRYFPAMQRAWAEERALHEKGVFSLGLGFLWDEAEFEHFLRSFATTVYDRIAERKPEATHLIDKRPPYAFHMDTINQVLPGSRYLNIVRDGRDVTVSMLKLWKRLGWFSGTARGSAREWRRQVEAARSAANRDLPYLEVRYEDLLGSGERTLRQILEFLDLEWSDQDIRDCLEQHGFGLMQERLQGVDASVRAKPVHFGSGTAGGWQHALSARQCCAIEQEAGELLRELGYTEDTDWWVRRPWQRLTLPMISRVPSLPEITPLLADKARKWLHPDITERISKTRLSRRMLSQRTNPRTGDSAAERGE